MRTHIMAVRLLIAAVVLALLVVGYLATNPGVSADQPPKTPAAGSSAAGQVIRVKLPDEAQVKRVQLPDEAQVKKVNLPDEAQVKRVQLPDEAQVKRVQLPDEAQVIKVPMPAMTTP